MRRFRLLVAEASHLLIHSGRGASALVGPAGGSQRQHQSGVDLRGSLLLIERGSPLEACFDVRVAYGGKRDLPASRLLLTEASHPKVHSRRAASALEGPAGKSER